MKIDVRTYSLLLSILFSLVMSSSAYAQTSTIGLPPETKTTEKPLEKEAPATISFSAVTEITRGTSLYDFKDGTRSDDFGLMLNPSMVTPYGLVSAKVSYTEDLNNNENIENGFSDIVMTYAQSFPTYEWATKSLSLAPSVNVVIPVSDVSVKKNQLKTAFSLAFGASITPKAEGDLRADGFSVAVAVTAGRSIHDYEEDINGQVLNQYSSNQSLSIGYAYDYWTASFEYVNRSRWTYQGNIRQSFVATQEISYAFSDNVYATVGHTNDAASVLKANGYESNVQIVDENNSAVYLTMGLSI